MPQTWSKADKKYMRKTRFEIQMRIEKKTASSGDYQFLNKLNWIMKEYGE